MTSGAELLRRWSDICGLLRVWLFIAVGVLKNAKDSDAVILDFSGCRETLYLAVDSETRGRVNMLEFCVTIEAWS
jgi:hypothetical protein